MSLRRWTEEEKQRVREMSEYATVYQIAEALNRSPQTVQNLCSKHKIALMYTVNDSSLTHSTRRHLNSKRRNYRQTGSQSKVSEISKRCTTIDIENDDLITTADAAKILGVSVTEVRRWVGAGKQFSNGKSIRLECVIYRGVTCTTAESVERFKELTRTLGGDS